LSEGLQLATEYGFDPAIGRLWFVPPVPTLQLRGYPEVFEAKRETITSGYDVLIMNEAGKTAAAMFSSPQCVIYF